MSDLEAARQKIREADQKLIPILSQFNLAANPNRELPEDLLNAGHDILREREAPTHLLDLVLRPLDLESFRREKLFDTVKDIARLLADRYEPLPIVALQKVEEGRTDAYDKPQHDAVIMNAINKGVDLGTRHGLIELVYGPLTWEFVKMQNEYLEERTGPIAISLGLEQPT